MGAHPSLLFARLGICRVAGFQRSPLHNEDRAFAAPETDSSLLILFCGYMWGRGENAFRRTKVITIHTTGRSHRRIMVAGYPGSRGFRGPGGSSSITRPAKPRTHPGLGKRETCGTRSYLISLPKIKDGSGQETRATRRSEWSGVRVPGAPLIRGCRMSGKAGRCRRLKPAQDFYFYLPRAYALG